MKSKKHVARQYELGWVNEPFRLCGEAVEVQDLGRMVAAAVKGGPVGCGEMFPAALIRDKKSGVALVIGKGGGK